VPIKGRSIDQDDTATSIECSRLDGAHRMITAFQAMVRPCRFPGQTVNELTEFRSLVNDDGSDTQKLYLTLPAAIRPNKSAPAVSICECEEFDRPYIMIGGGGESR